MLRQVNCELFAFRGMAFKCSLLPLSLVFFHVFLVSSLHAFEYEDGSFRGLDHDFQVLLELRRTLDVDSSLWDTSESPCEWFGVYCDEMVTNDGVGMEKRVVGLELDSRELKGSLSPAIGGLSELKKISLANNFLHGKIPKEVAFCLKLEVVDLSGNKLSGPIPSEFSNLRSLKVLHLSDNTLSGEISFLSLRTRSSPSGPFPFLEHLNLANNRLTGMIPYDIARFSTLESLFSQWQHACRTDSSQFGLYAIFGSPRPTQQFSPWEDPKNISQQFKQAAVFRCIRELPSGKNLSLLRKASYSEVSECLQQQFGRSHSMGSLVQIWS